MPAPWPDAADEEEIRFLCELLTGEMLSKPWGYKLFLSGSQPLVHGIGIRTDPNILRQSVVLLTSHDPSLIHIDGLIELAHVHPSLGERISVLPVGPPVLCARPVLGGDSVSFEKHPTGSTGCVVEDETEERFLLSCNHVLANGGAGTPGISCIWQPGALAGGTSADRIGVLHDFKPIDFGGSAARPNRMDAALCRPDQSTDLDPALMTLGRIKGVNAAPGYNIDVQKHGGQRSSRQEV